MFAISLRRRRKTNTGVDFPAVRCRRLWDSFWREGQVIPSPATLQPKRQQDWPPQALREGLDHFVELSCLPPMKPWLWLVVIFPCRCLQQIFFFFVADEAIHVSKLAVWGGNLFYT